MTEFDIFYYKPKNRRFLETLENNIDNPQNYVPIYKAFFELNENNYNHISLNHRYHVLDCVQFETEKENLLYKYSNMVATLHDSETSMDVKKQIFIKYSPVLDPVRYMIGKYDIYNDSLKTLPQYNSTNKTCNSKLLDTNNSSYIDSFFTYLTSKLLHTHHFIHGIDFYGSFMGVQREFKMNVDDDFEYLQNSKFFRKNLGELFDIINPYSDFDNDFSSSSHAANAAASGGGGSMINSRNCKSRIEVTENVEELVFDEMPEFHISAPVAMPDKIEVLYEKPEDEMSMESDDSSICNSSDDGLDILDKDDFEIEDLISQDDDEDEDEESSYTTLSSTESDTVIATIKNFPVQMICLEKCEGTLDSLMISPYFTEEEWKSALFQVIMSLAVFQKSFYLTHNDLHTNNIMYVNTEHKYIYYKIENYYFKVPTYGKIYKIIDFGRAIYTFRGKLFCSDSFDFHGDAAEQYNFPPYYNDKKKLIEPNYSFDLCRLGCSIYDSMIEDGEEIHYNDFSPIKKLIYEWCCDDRGKNILYKKNGEERYPNFKLYKMIARIVHNHTPFHQFTRPIFQSYAIQESEYMESAATAAATEEFIDVDKIPCYASAPAHKKT